MTNDVLDRLNAWNLDEWDQNVADDVRNAIAEIERLRHENAQDPVDPFLEAARVVGQVYQGCGDVLDAHRMLGLMIMTEHFISGGGDHAAECMGWDIAKKSATVTALETVRKLATETPSPQDR